MSSSPSRAHPYTRLLLAVVPRRPREAAAAVGDRREHPGPRGAARRLPLPSAVSRRDPALPRGRPDPRRRTAPTAASAAGAPTSWPTGSDFDFEQFERADATLSRSQSLTPLLAVEGLVREFTGGRRGVLRAVDDVSFHVGPGETLGLVGESGLRQDHGRAADPAAPAGDGRAHRVRRPGRHRTSPSARLRDFRRAVQVVFQDPYSSLNPRLTVRDIVGEPLRNFGATRRAAAARVGELLDTVGLPPTT